MTKFWHAQIKIGVVSLLLTMFSISTLSSSRGSLCSKENLMTNNTEWHSSMSLCISKVHESSLDDAVQLAAPAYNALVYVLLFAGVTSNILSRFLTPTILHERFHDAVNDGYVQNVEIVEHVEHGHNQEIDNNDADTNEVIKVDAEDLHKDDTLCALGDYSAYISKQSERSVCVCVVLTTQCYVFFLACLWAVVIDAWWIDV